MMTLAERMEIERWKRRGVLIDRVCLLAIAFGGTFLIAACVL